MFSSIHSDSFDSPYFRWFFPLCFCVSSTQFRYDVNINNHYLHADVVSFAESKESYSKKLPAKNFTYFDNKQLRKIANTANLKLISSKSTPAVTSESTSKAKSKSTTKKQKRFPNGLWQDINLYNGLGIEFVLAKKNGSTLTNKIFEALNPNMSIPESLMKYLINSLPRKPIAIVSENGYIEWDLVLPTKVKTEFIVMRTDYGWLLIIIDHKTKTFGFVNQQLFAGWCEGYTKYLRSKKYTNIRFENLKPPDDYNSGIFIYHCIRQHIATGAPTPRKEFDADVYRTELKLEIIKKSENIKNDCTVCGIGDDGPPMVECSSCMRWLHCHCIKVSLKEVENDKDFKCPLCVMLKF